VPRACPFRRVRATTARHNTIVRLLVVEDDEMLAESLCRGLQAEGYAVDLARDGTDALHLATEIAYDGMILDIMLPGLNGYVVCARLRAAGDRTPILILTAKDGEWDQAEGLDTGADDYLVKPFRYPVLLAHVRALLRRGPSRQAPILEYGGLRLDPATHRCWRHGEPVELTPREFAVLRYLLSHPGQVLSKLELLDHVWGDFDADNHNVVEVYISSLRRKIDVPDRASSIRTVRGVGYLLSDEE
jgi:DNA-binding response OmpR family regulator